MRLMGEGNMTKYKLVCNLSFGDVFVQAIIWALLTIVTLGLALPFFGYFAIRLIINHTEIHAIAVTAT